MSTRDYVGSLPPERRIRPLIEHATLEDMAQAVRESAEAAKRVAEALKQRGAELDRRAAEVAKLPARHWKREQLERDRKQWGRELDGLLEQMQLNRRMMDTAVRVLRGKEMDMRQVEAILRDLNAAELRRQQRQR